MENNTDNMKSNVTKFGSIGVVGLIGIVALFGTVYTVEEGHIGIVKRFNEAKSQVNPGLHFKIPFIDSVESIEVRTRKNEEKMSSSTKSKCQ